MKIGVLTFWTSSDNYGQLLQCYALQTYLKSVGHDAYLIRYIGNVSKWKKILQKTGKLLMVYPVVRRFINRHKLKKDRDELAVLNDKNKLRKFQDFRFNYLEQSSVVYKNLSELKKNPPIADCYIVGSDQVWAKLLNEVENNAFYLDFGAKNIKRISYATSFAMKSYPQKMVSRLQEQLKRMDSISVREMDGVHICNSIGYEAEWVLDPTFLLEKSMYLRLIEHSYKKAFKYAFVYSINISDASEIQWKILESIFQKEDITPVVTISSGYLFAKELFEGVDYSYASLEEWLTNIFFSEFVVTTSFHGVVFCILLKKNFIYFPLKGLYESGNNRVYDLLEHVGLMNKIVESHKELSCMIKEPIDWEAVDNKLFPLIEKSKQYLKKCLT